MSAPVTDRDLIEAAAQDFNLSPADLLYGGSKKRLHVDARHVAMYLLRERGLSLPAAGRAMGGMDHTTVLHAIRRVQADPELRLRADSLAKHLKLHGHKRRFRFYIASSLDNVLPVRALAATLTGDGHVHTYDWTQHGSVQRDGDRTMREAAHAEITGVADAHVVFVLLPGGRGTHVVLGAALALKRPVVMYAPTPEALRGERADELHCAFYHHVLVRIVVSPWETFLLDASRIAAEMMR